MDDADRSFVEFGHDIDGDGIGDLCVLAHGEFVVFAGRRDLRKPFDKARRTSVPLGDLLSDDLESFVSMDETGALAWR